MSIWGGASGNTIGGTVLGAGNVISGNGQASNFTGGIILSGSGTSNNLIGGNLIGTDVSGTAALGNAWDGVLIWQQASGNTVGGTTPAARNVISGNAVVGVGISGSGTTGNLVEGNYVGTDVNGTAALGNQGNGVQIDGGATANTIGGSAAGTGNVLSGNGLGSANFAGGLWIVGSGTSGNVVAGNFIGTDKTGTAPLGNKWTGLAILDGASANTIGGTAPGDANVISANAAVGVEVQGAGTSSNVLLGNLIGTNKNGTFSLGNTFSGVQIWNGATDNTVGGTAAGARNVISGNGQAGVLVFGSGSSGNVVQGNDIGTDITGTIALPNVAEGVQVLASNNTIGGTQPGAGNTIEFNGADGVFVGGGATGVSILGNAISASGGLGIYLDSATRANDNQAAPMQATAVYAAGGTTISGTLASVASTAFRLKFFSNKGLDASGNREGMTYLGFALVSTDANGYLVGSPDGSAVIADPGSANATFTTNLAAMFTGDGYLTATATNLSTGDTSEFGTVFLPATVSVNAPCETYNAQPYSLATATVTGLNGATITDGTVTFTYYVHGQSTPLPSAPTNAGTYDVHANYSGDQEYAPAGTTATFTICPATPYVVVNAPGESYNAQPYSLATALVTGVGSDGTLASATLDSATLSFSFYAGAVVTGSPLGGAPTNPGTYTVVAQYTSDNLNYNNADSLPVTFTITPIGVTIAGDVYVLNQTASGALTVAGAATLNVVGTVQVDSNSASAVILSGNAVVNAAQTLIVGGDQVSGHAGFDNPVTTAAAYVADPLAALAAQAGSSAVAVNLSGGQTLTLDPGVYSSITVSGNAHLTLNPGIYIIGSGGVTVSGNAAVTSGQGVLCTTTALCPSAAMPL